MLRHLRSAFAVFFLLAVTVSSGISWTQETANLSKATQLRVEQPAESSGGVSPVKEAHKLALEFQLIPGWWSTQALLTGLHARQQIVQFDLSFGGAMRRILSARSHPPTAS